MSLIKHVLSASELDQLLSSHPDRLTVIDFWATWCGPCHAIAPLFETLSKQYKHAAFCKVDIDKLKEVAQKYKVTAVPTFVFVRNSTEVTRMKGAGAKELRELVATYAGQPPAATPAEGSTSKGKDADLSDSVSLLEFLDPSQLNCLNESDDHNIKSIISTKGKTTGSAYLESDADEQLLLNIYFNQAVRVRALVIHSKDPNSGPKTIKIFTNKPALGFEDVEDAEEPEAAQVLDLSEANLKDRTPIVLRTVRFGRVNSLHIFVASNQSEQDATRIDSLDILGLPIETTKMSNFKKTEDE